MSDKIFGTGETRKLFVAFAITLVAIMLFAIFGGRAFPCLTLCIGYLLGCEN